MITKDNYKVLDQSSFSDEYCPGGSLDETRPVWVFLLAASGDSPSKDGKFMEMSFRFSRHISLFSYLLSERMEYSDENQINGIRKSGNSP